MPYAVVIKSSDGKFSAEVPDLPGCAATAASLAEAKSKIQAAIRKHLAKLERDGLPAPAATTVVELIDT